MGRTQFASSHQSHFYSSFLTTSKLIFFSLFCLHACARARACRAHGGRAVGRGRRQCHVR